MRSYQFSPIKNKAELLEAIQYIHFGCYKLCKQSFGKYLKNAGNMGVFCHFDDEFEFLKQIRQEITKPSDNPDQKYFELYESLIIESKEDVPKTIYTHLYIRRPDQNTPQVGDVDFYLETEEYSKLKQEMLNGKKIKGARMYDRKDLDMIELFDSEIDALAYVSTPIMAEKVRIKLSDATKL
jgi:hypothetical protein